MLEGNADFTAEEMREMTTYVLNNEEQRALLPKFGELMQVSGTYPHTWDTMKHDHDHGHDHGHANHHLHPIVVDQDQLKQIDPRLPDILKHHNHDHEHDTVVVSMHVITI